jgi:hypothetical protein
MKLHEEIRQLAKQDPQDPWGDAISTAFAIADVLYAAGEHIPVEWEFHASSAFDDDVDTMAENADDEHSYATETLANLYMQRGITADELRYAGNVLSRYNNLLKAAGLNY